MKMNFFKDYIFCKFLSHFFLYTFLCNIYLKFRRSWRWWRWWSKYWRSREFCCSWRRRWSFNSYSCLLTRCQSDRPSLRRYFNRTFSCSYLNFSLFCNLKSSSFTCLYPCPCILCNNIYLSRNYVYCNVSFRINKIAEAFSCSKVYNCPSCWSLISRYNLYI